MRIKILDPGRTQIFGRKMYDYSCSKCGECVSVHHNYCSDCGTELTD